MIEYSFIVVIFKFQNIEPEYLNINEVYLHKSVMLSHVLKIKIKQYYEILLQVIISVIGSLNLHGFK